jgi:hypothetical protein
MKWLGLASPSNSSCFAPWHQPPIRITPPQVIAGYRHLGQSTRAHVPNLEVPVIDALLNLLSRCPHRRLTCPVAPITNVGQQHSQGYVVCLDCGKLFEYDMEGMRIGKLIDDSHDVCVVPKNMTLPLARKVKYAALAVVPVALVIGTVVKAKKVGLKKDVRTGDAPVAPATGGPGVPE